MQEKRLEPPFVQRQEEEEEETEETAEPVQAKQLSEQFQSLVQREAEEEDKEEEEKPETFQTMPPDGRALQRREEEKEGEEEPLQTKGGRGATSSLARDQEFLLWHHSGTGSKLPEFSRTFFETRFGHDFGQVRIHADNQAADIAHSINAQAFTHGRDIYFGAGRYQPHTNEGQRLLAHELTHVVQQTMIGRTAGIQVRKTEEPLLQGSFFGDVWAGIKGVAGSIWEGVKVVGGAIWKGLTAAAEWTWGALKKLGNWGWDALQSVGAWIWDIITETPLRVWRLLTYIGSGIVGVVSWLWKGVRGSLAHLWEAVKGVFTWAGKGVVGFFSWIWEGLKGGGRWAWRLLQGDFSGFWEGIGGIFSWLGGGAVRLAQWGWTGLKAAALWAWEGAKGVGKWLWEGLLAGSAWVGQLVAKLLDLAGFGEIMDLLWQILKFNTRSLTATEIAEAKKVFGDSIPYWQVRVDEYSLIAKIGGWLKGGVSMGVTTFHTVNFNQKITPSPGSADMAWLVHEVTHVSQMEHAGMQYIGEAVHAQTTTGYGYGGTAGLTADRAAGKHFRDYNREQQAQIAGDYYSAHAAGRPTGPFDPFIVELRNGDL